VKFERKSMSWVVVSIALFILIAVIGLSNSKNLEIGNDMLQDENIDIFLEGNVEGYNRDKLAEIIYLVKQIEEIDHKFSNYYLTYNQYIDETEKLSSLLADWIVEENHYNRNYIPSPLDIRTYNQKQIDEIRNSLENPSNIKVELSKVYKDGERIYIFTKSTIDDGTSYPSFFINRRYDITQFDGELKITSININIYDDRIKEALIRYNTFNNERVEYVHSFEPLMN